MTAPTLPDTLRRLAELLPLRVRHDARGTAGVVEVWVQTRTRLSPVSGITSLHTWAFVGCIGPDARRAPEGFSVLELRLLEAALREEIEARGWAHGVLYLPEQGEYTAMVRSYPGQEEPHQGEHADAAHALALALLKALVALAGGAA